MTVYYGIDNIDVRIDNGTFADVNTATAPTSCERCTGSITNAVVCSMIIEGLRSAVKLR